MTILQKSRIHFQHIQLTFRVLKYFLRYRGAFLFSFAMIVISTLINVLFPLVVVLTFELILDRQFDLLPSILSILAVLYLVALVSQFLARFIVTRTSERAVMNLRNEVYRHINALSMDFFLENQSGNLISRLSDDISQLRRAISSILSSLTINLLTVFGALYIMYSLVGSTVFLIPIFLIPILVLVFGLGYTLSYLSRAIQSRLAEAFSHAESTIEAMPVVQAYAQEEREQERFRYALQDAYNATMRIFLWEAGADSLFTLVGRISATVVVILVARVVSQSELELTTMMAFLYYLIALWGALQALLWVYLSVQSVGGATSRIFEILDMQPLVEDMPDSIVLPTIRGAICFEDITFYYGHDKILDNLNLDIPRGQTVAIVGKSGIGKTTLARLVMRFYDPFNGRVLIDGVDIRSVTLESLRKQIGIAFQDPILMGISIRENIAYGVPDADDATIIRAAQLAHIHDFIVTQEEGYNTLVGSRGLRLSRGQQQRLALARMFASDPRIMILDEATASLDPNTEHQILRAMLKEYHDTTTILITHNLETIQLADRIILLDEGVIVADTTYQAVLNSSKFREVFQIPTVQAGR